MQYKRRYKGRKIWRVRARTREQRWQDAPALGPMASVAQRPHRDFLKFLNYFCVICQSSRCFSMEEHPSNPVTGSGLPRDVWEPGGGGGGIAPELCCHTGTHRPCSWQMYIESNLLHICLNLLTFALLSLPQNGSSPKPGSDAADVWHTASSSVEMTDFEQVEHNT